MTPRRAVIALILALAAAIIGFAGIAGPFDDIARPLALLFLLVFFIGVWRTRRRLR